jgi:HSP20 family molecular chaperone IbpA
VTTVDCCYHPDTLQLAKANTRFRDLIVQTAFDAIEKSFKTHQKMDISLKKEYHILKGVEYKSGDVASMMVQKEPKSSAAQSLASKVTQQESKPEGTKGPPAAAAKESAPGPVEPRYVVVERGQFELSDHMSDASSPCGKPRRPRELVIRVILPGLTSAKGVHLDVSMKELTVKYKDQYHLQLPLPYPIIEEQGSAKFDKSKNTLVVTAPVVPLPKAKKQDKTPDMLVQEPPLETAEPVTVPAVEVLETAEPVTVPAVEVLSSTRAAVSTSAKHHSQVGKDYFEEHHSTLLNKPETSLSADDVAELLAAAKTGTLIRQEENEAPPIMPTDNSSKPSQGQEAERNTPVGGEGTESFEDDGTSVPSTQERFVQSSVFAGAKPGYVFKKGDLGVGYYADPKTPSSQPAGKEKTVEPLLAGSPAKEVEPPYEYKQNEKTVSILINVPDVAEDSVQLKVSGVFLDFSFKTSGSGTVFRLKLDSLFAPVVAEKCWHNVADTNVVLVLQKKKESEVRSCNHNQYYGTLLTKIIMTLFFACRLGRNLQRMLQHRQR